MPVKIGGAGDGSFYAPQESGGLFDWLKPQAASTQAPQEPPEDFSPDTIKPMASHAQAEPEQSWLDKLRRYAGMGIRVGSGMIGAGASANLELGPAAPLLGGAIGGLGEAAAELVGGEDLSPARIGVEAGLTAVPLGKIYKGGEIARSALRGAGLASTGVVGRQWARGEPLHAGWGEAADVALGGGMGALFGTFPEAEGAASAISKTAQKAEVAAKDAAAPPKAFEVEPTSRGTAGKDVFKAPPRPIEPSGTPVGAPYEVPSMPTPLRPPTPVRAPLRSFLDELRERGTGLNEPPGPYPAPSEPTPFTPSTPEPAGPIPYGGSPTGPAPYRSAAKAAAKTDLDAFNAERIRQARMAAGAEPGDPNFTESLKGTTPGGKTTSMTTRFSVPKGEEEEADALGSMFTLKAPRTAQVPSEAQTPPIREEVAQTVKSARQPKAPVEPPPVAEPRPDEFQPEALPPTKAPPGGFTPSPATLGIGDRLQAELGRVGEAVPPDFQLPQPTPPLKGGVAQTAVPSGENTVDMLKRVLTHVQGQAPLEEAAVTESPARFFEGTPADVAGTNYRELKDLFTSGKLLGTGENPASVQQGVRTAGRALSRLGKEEGGVASELTAPPAQAAPEQQAAGLPAGNQPPRGPAGTAPPAVTGEPTTLSKREQIENAYEKVWGKPKEEWTSAQKQAVREQMRKSPEGLAKWLKMTEENPEAVGARAKRGQESFLKKMERMGQKAEPAGEEFGGVAGAKAEPGSADDWSFGADSEYEPAGEWVPHEVSEAGEPQPPMEPGVQAEDRPSKGAPTPPPQIREIVKNADLSTWDKVKAAANTIYERLPQFQRANLLFSASGLPANAVVGPYSSGVMAALERGLSGDSRGWQLLKEMHPVNWAKEFWEAKGGEARRLIEEGEMGRAETVSGGGAGSTLTQKYLAMPGVYMTAGDVATRNAAMRAGFTEQEARQFTLTSEPETDQLRRYIEFPKGSPLYNMLFPFRRTAANIWEQGAQRAPGLGFIVQARRAGGGDPMMQQLVQQGLATAMGGGAYMVGANVDPETSKALQKYIQNMGGQYELMTTMGLAAGQLAQGGKDLGAQVKGGLTGGITKLPLPSTQTLQDLAALLSGEGKMPGGVLPQLGKEAGMWGGKESTGITPIKVK